MCPVQKLRGGLSCGVSPSSGAFNLFWGESISFTTVFTQHVGLGLTVLDSDKSLSRRVPSDFVFHSTERGGWHLRDPRSLLPPQGPGLGLVGINQPGMCLPVLAK